MKRIDYLKFTNQYQGTLMDRYLIYVACSDEDDYIKTFEEWLDS